jgi:dolichol kinase
MDSLSRDAIALALSIAYCTAAIGAAELIRKLRGYGDEFTRKLVHIAIGLWIIPTLFLFTKWYWAAALPALAVLGNAVSLRYNLLRGIERGVKTDLGTVYFPVSFVICIAAFFQSDYRVAAAAGIIPMALGDAAAAIVGRTAGRHPYTLLGARKSVEGSAAMFVVTALSVFATLLIPAFHVSVGAAALVAAVLAVVATALEAVGKNGLDNLTVPVVCSILAFGLLKGVLGVSK